MNNIKVLSKGQIVIPARIRKKFEIKPGSMIQMFEYDNLIYLVPPSADALKSAMGCLPNRPSLSDELMAERKKDFAE
jgi:AbrB family looped-hinge helix DNA binding protein